MRARTLGAVGALALQVLLALAMLFAVAFDREYYSGEYARLGVYESCGADAATLERATDMLLSYLRGEVDGLEGRGTIDGQERDIFGADERAHMVDVKRLFELALVVMLCAGAVALVCALCAGRDRRRMAQGALMGLGAFAALLLAAGAWCALDFGGAFTAFHELLFYNDLWLMDASTQFMIRMFPSEFFSGMGMRIALYTGMGMLAQALVYALCGFYGGKRREVR